MALETDWMTVEKDSRDEQSGARIVDVAQVRDDSNSRLVTIAIPKKSVKRYQDIEEVVVIGKRKDNREMRLPDINYEWASDYDRDYYGLIIRIGNSDIPIRLFLHATQEDPMP